MNRCRQIVLLLAALSGTAWTIPPGRDKNPPPVVRWAEEQPGCTFSRGDDGKYRYGIWKDDWGIVLAVDGRELQQTPYRLKRLITVELTINYRGNGSQSAPTGAITLEYVSHFQVVHPALDPDDLSTALQDLADAYGDQIEHEVRKHPEQKDTQEAKLQEYEKGVTELQEFVVAHGLRPGRVDPGNREVSGWLFFDAKDKWIAGWKKTEEFVLRVPLGGKLYEFPFKLPPPEGDLILRKRPFAQLTPPNGGVQLLSAKDTATGCLAARPGP